MSNTARRPKTVRLATVDAVRHRSKGAYFGGWDFAPTDIEARRASFYTRHGSPE